MKLSLPSRASLAVVPLLLLLPAATPAAAAPEATSGCRLPAGDVRHVVYVQFDNVHLRRDDPNVPSDLEQMPNLLNLLQDEGAVLDNHHTELISHTAGGFLTSITGLRADEHGQAVQNSYREYVNADGTTVSVPSFQYWTALTADGTFNLLTSEGRNTPAPWVPYTRAGCNVGTVAMANTVLEGVGDVARVFGPGSPEAAEVASGSPSAAPDFVGIAVHCARDAALCSAANHGAPDVLPQEPGGYSGFNGLFGHKYTVAQMGGGPLTDLDGNVIGATVNGATIPGFPGFDGMRATVSLAYTAAMQEHGVPITYTYISDAHVDAQGRDAGPGNADYVARLRSYDQAFGRFFARLEAHGIDRHNTLFVVTADENDHFVGGPPSPAGCDGVHTPCTYAQIGEIAANLRTLMQQAGNTTPFALHADSAPAIWLNGQPARDAAVTRDFARTLEGIQVTNPLRGRTEHLVDFMVDSVGLRLLHMVTADPRRTPTLVAFGNEDYFISTSQACSPEPVAECPGFAWIHGDIQEDITRTWLGMVGPGVRHVGRTDLFTDQTDVRPTMMVLTGLRDDYVHPGRALIEVLSDADVPQSLRAHRATLQRLGEVYEQVNSPLGQFSLDGVRVSTTALGADDQRYAELENELTGLTGRRDALAAGIDAVLEDAAFGGRRLDERQARALIDEAQDLLAEARALAHPA